MNALLEKLSSRVIYVSFFLLAVAIPFSIAGATAAIFLGIIGWLLAFCSNPSARKMLAHIRRDPFSIICLVLVVSAIPSVLMSENVGRAFNDWKSYWLLTIYFLVAANLPRGKLRDGLFWTLFGAVTLSCLVAIIQHYGGIDLILFSIKPKHRPGSTLYPMTLAGILYQMILLNFSVLNRERRISLTGILLGAGVLIQTAALLFTLTRGAYAALLGGLCVAFLILRNKRAFAGAAVLVAILAVFVTQNPTDLDRSISVPNIVNRPPDRHVRTRFILWDISVDLFKQHPVFGVGMGDYSTEAEKLLEERKVTTTVDSHNIYLQILATRGLFGFIPFVLFWGILLRDLFRLRSRLEPGSFERHLALGAIAATAAVLVGALTENNIDDSEVFIAYLFMIGFARSAAFQQRSSSGGG
ncbi:MAG: hypothetical protein GTO51_11195 [Candidatus Latescibacteria bacterium]|nr:hypothetical protein [Candidatus Latescibacterota bacterium]NIM66529.1 hypothetical protein [Candidatus Latescibacterota bacterium]NIO03009.1 hypothetical protein [Candidatus Latescibacterota bacterium]NIO30144.1 hypothetical protein [Candidatus Latescibacterota bacterium]NIO57763.1 hypothetical protein [Candidatus Latescibacterota bacterium]